MSENIESIEFEKNIIGYQEFLDQIPNLTIIPEVQITSMDETTGEIQGSRIIKKPNLVDVYRINSKNTFEFTETIFPKLSHVSIIKGFENIGFGSSVSSFNDDLIIGAPYFVNRNMDTIGAFFHYKHSNNSTVFMNIYTHPLELSETKFGESCEMSENYIVISASEENTNSKNINYNNTGCIYIYSRIFTENNRFKYLYKISPDIISSNLYFGTHIKTSRNILLIGSPSEQIDSDSSGVVYVINLTNDFYNTIQKIEAPNYVKNLKFGSTFNILKDIIMISYNNRILFYHKNSHNDSYSFHNFIISSDLKYPNENNNTNTNFASSLEVSENHNFFLTNKSYNSNDFPGLSIFINYFKK